MEHCRRYGVRPNVALSEWLLTGIPPRRLTPDGRTRHKAGMTCAHLCLLTQLMHLLERTRGGIHLRLGDDLAPNELGCVDFPTNTITIASTATLREFRSTLAHELVHLMRGPALVGQEDSEEEIVEQEAARLMVPATHVSHLTDVTTVAELLIIDDALAELGLRLAYERALHNLTTTT